MNYVAGLLFVLMGISSWFAYDFKSKLGECMKLPDIRSSFAHVSRYVGTERSFRFTLVCSGEIENFYNDCSTKEMADVTNKQVVMEPYRNGKFFRGSYSLDWIEKINYFVDLSDPKMWTVDIGAKRVSISIDKIEFERVLDNKKLLPFVIDKEWGKNDKDYLLKIIKKSDEFSLPKSKTYLEENRKVIEEEMAKSLKRLVGNVATKVGYPDATVIEVVIGKNVY